MFASTDKTPVQRAEHIERNFVTSIDYLCEASVGDIERTKFTEPNWGHPESPIANKRMHPAICIVCRECFHLLIRKCHPKLKIVIPYLHRDVREMPHNRKLHPPPDWPPEVIRITAL